MFDSVLQCSGNVYWKCLVPHSAVKCLVWRQFAWLSRAGARGESCGPTKNAHLYRDMARVPDTRVQIQTCGDTCLDIYAPGTIMSRAAGGNKIGFNYYSCPIKIYRPIVSWQLLLWNLEWIMKHWLLLNSILMGVANSWSNIIRIIRASPA